MRLALAGRNQEAKKVTDVGLFAEGQRYPVIGHVRLIAVSRGSQKHSVPRRPRRTPKKKGPTKIPKKNNRLGRESGRNMPRSLLLGNGFSRAYNNGLFAYDTLYQGAAFSQRLQQIFNLLGTTDFEAVMRALGQTQVILPPYVVPAEYGAEMQRDVELVRDSLIQALTRYHPPSRAELDEPRAAVCAQFLANFDRIFTTNYDLLLYWVFLDNLAHQHQDGFSGGANEPLVWRGPRAPGQSVYYLHGALHLYDDEENVYKIRSRGRMLDQLRVELDRGNYPLFVSEGTSRQKMARIRSNPYLFDAYEALSNNDFPLFVYGFKFGDMDEHILGAIGKSRIPKLRVSLFAGSDGDEKSEIKRRANKMASTTPARNDVSFIESSAVPVWDAIEK